MENTKIKLRKKNQQLTAETHKSEQRILQNALCLTSLGRRGDVIE